MQALVSIHGERGGMAEGFLSPEETSIIQGALDLTSLTASHAMTPLDKVAQSFACVVAANSLLFSAMLLVVSLTRRPIWPQMLIEDLPTPLALACYGNLHPAVAGVHGAAGHGTRPRAAVQYPPHRAQPDPSARAGQSAGCRGTAAGERAGAA